MFKHSSVLLSVIVLLQFNNISAYQCENLELLRNIIEYVTKLNDTSETVYFAFDFSFMTRSNDNYYFSINGLLKYPVFITFNETYEIIVVNDDDTFKFELKISDSLEFSEFDELFCKPKTMNTTLVAAMQSNIKNRSSATSLHTCEIKSDNSSKRIAYRDFLVTENWKSENYSELIQRNKIRLSFNLNGSAYNQCFCEELLHYMDNCRFQNDSLGFIFIVFGVILSLALISTQSCAVFSALRTENRVDIDPRD